LLSPEEGAPVPLDPPIQVLLDLYNQVKPPPGLSVEERRQLAAAGPLISRPPRPEGVHVEDHKVAVKDGEIAVRVLRPEGLDRPGPGYFYIHGGGWAFGNLDGGEVESGVLCTDIGATVVVVDYRLAPEHKFPVPLAAYRWVLDHAPELGIDPARLALGGGSAGANLAAALCLMLRDEGLTLPCIQLLDVPALDLTMGSASMVGMGPEAWLSAADVAEAAGFYLASPDDARDPLASPLLAPDLAGLPPAVILVAEFDPVRDDGERYARRLHEAGVPAATFRIIAHAHGTYAIPGTLTSQLVRDMRVSTLRRAFDGTLVPGGTPA
jgi:acetyl esterase